MRVADPIQEEIAFIPAGEPPKLAEFFQVILLRSRQVVNLDRGFREFKLAIVAGNVQWFFVHGAGLG